MLEAVVTSEQSDCPYLERYFSWLLHLLQTADTRVAEGYAERLYNLKESQMGEELAGLIVHNKIMERQDNKLEL